ncbi:UvrD-helicase domain-containing protein [Cytobacillus oceanisediminis]|uniref:DNA/RNA helicase n=1 Tax=Cytobacillus oceanisediminis 2691 TaxID=1196031 RepID=A0A160MHP7_9BACI|nr:UvrD-helicase domain-containing protein [Cytobacillus oceanisediminis]AND42613.1 DNA/RNA helicase [Cytobacillus oceanisediminis 2691]
MMPSNKRIVKAAAGTGKTTLLIGEAVKNYQEGKVLYLTYTNANLNSMKSDLMESVGIIPKNIKCKTWTDFLLNECAKPYRKVLGGPEIGVFNFCSLGEIPRLKGVKAVHWRYYYDSQGRLYYERLAQFCHAILEASAGVIIDRLEKIYSTILIDEVQDMGGYDLKIIEAIYQSNLNLVVVGDHRQATYSTNSDRFLSRYRGVNIFNFFTEVLRHDTLESLDVCHRCPQIVCDLANTLYSDLNMRTAKSVVHEDIGTYLVSMDNVSKFIEQYKPTLLYYNVSSLNKFISKLDGDINFESITFGKSKGLSYENVLILPTKEMENHVTKGNHKMSDTVIAQFYVAITRSKNNVAILTEKSSVFDFLKTWTIIHPPQEVSSKQ